MLTNDSYSFLNSPNQWSYNACESFVDISFNLDIALDVNVGDEYRIFLTPAITSSTTPFTYLDPIWHGSLQVFASQSVDKPAYVNQIPLDDQRISRDSVNEFIYWDQTTPFVPTTTTTLAPTTTTTLAPTTTTTIAPTTTTTTTPGAPDVIFTFGNQIGGQGFNVCYSGNNTSPYGVGILFTEYKCFMSSDAGCTTPYGTSWDLSFTQSNFFNPGVTTGQFTTNTGGSISPGNFYRTRISGSFQFDIPALSLPFSPLQSFDLSGGAYQDLVYGGLRVRIQGPNCTLNNAAGC